MSLYIFKLLVSAARGCPAERRDPKAAAETRTGTAEVQRTSRRDI